MDMYTFEENRDICSNPQAMTYTLSGQVIYEKYHLNIVNNANPGCSKEFHNTSICVVATFYTLHTAIAPNENDYTSGSNSHG